MAAAKQRRGEGEVVMSEAQARVQIACLVVLAVAAIGAALFWLRPVLIPFMLALMELPSDFFNLFLMAGVWSARLGDLAGGMHLLA